MRKVLILLLELALVGGCFGAGYLSRSGNLVRNVLTANVLDAAKSPQIITASKVPERVLRHPEFAAQAKIAEEQKKLFDSKTQQSTPSLPRLDRTNFNNLLFAPSDLNLAGVEEAWDERVHQVVVQTDGEVSAKVKGKLRLQFLKKRGFSAREGSLEEIHALRINPNYHPEKYMLNYPGGKLSIPTHDEKGRPLPEEHIRALMARATQFDSQTMLGPYPSTFSELESVRLSAGVPGLASTFSPQVSGLGGASPMGLPGATLGGRFVGPVGPGGKTSFSAYGPLGPLGAQVGQAGSLTGISAYGPMGGQMGPMGAHLGGPMGAQMGPMGGQMGPMGAHLGGPLGAQIGSVSGVGPIGTMKPGLYMPGSHPKVRQFLDESDPKNPFLVVWDPSKLSASLSAPADMNPVHERFRKVKGGGHQMWISSKARNSLEVQGRALDLASKGYRVFVTPPITLISTPEYPGLSGSLQTSSGGSSLLEGKLLVEKAAGLWPISALRFAGGDLVVQAIGWQGSKMLPPMLAESVRTLQRYRPQRIIIRDMSNSFWHLIGPYKASLIPGYVLPEKVISGIPSFPTHPVESGKGPYEKTSRFRRHIPADAPLWGKSATETGPVLMQRTERHGASELGRVLPVKPSGLFRDTNECLALQQYGREPYKFGLLSTMGSGKLYDMAVRAATKLREKGRFTFVEDVCLGLRIMITMYDEMRNDVQCTSVIRATAALKNEAGLDEFIKKEVCSGIFKMPPLPAVDLRPLNLALMNPTEIASHYNLRIFPKVAPYTSRLLGAAIHKSEALQEAIAASPLAKGIDSKIYRDVCSEISYTLQELNPFENSSAQQCAESVKAVLGLHVQQWELVDNAVLMDICTKSGYKALTSSELLTARIYGFKEVRGLFYLEKDHAVHRPYSLEDSVIFESKVKAHSAWCKYTTPEGKCVSTDLAKKCDGLPVPLVNRSQLFAYYSEQVLNKMVKGPTIPITTNTMCGIFSAVSAFSDDEETISNTLSHRLGSVFPIFVDNQAIVTWRGFLSHEKKIIKTKDLTSIYQLYSKPMKYISSSDQSLVAEFETEQEYKNKASKSQKNEETSAESSVATEGSEESEEE
ncbi:signal peptide-containing protein [Cryptosporidium canis]|uniref:Signal peptide-containing protein n=1 Tax=Cryptosporidium canis TaxID=195482 RepID=A0A9D5DJG5_9CRYT|nr:signal peptide-containing protein [Cryptosporidium canis]